MTNLLSPPSRPHWQRYRYRLRQFFQGLRAQVTAADYELVKTLLPPAAWPLFVQMPRDAQRHGLNVLTNVRQAGFEQPELLIAALLHDVGKCAAARNGIQLGLWQRGPLVILEALWPAGLRRFASPDPQSGWRYLLYVHLEHPHIGAVWAQQAGCPPLACWLIAQHQEKAPHTPDPKQLSLLNVLQTADDSH